MDQTKKKMIDQVKAQIKKQFDSDHIDLDIIRIYDDTSGLASLKSGRCGCCSDNVFDDVTRDIIRDYLTMEDQQEIAKYFTECLIKMYGFSDIELMDREMLKHLNAIIDYLYKDEKKHYHELDEGDRNGHVFIRLEALKDWTLGK